MNALITGANGDIGLSTVKFLLAKNYTVTAIDKFTDKLEVLSQQYPLLNIIRFDLANTYELEGWLNESQQEYDVLIYAAGIREIKSLINLTLDEWLKVMDVNLTSAFLLSRHIAEIAITNNKSLNIIYVSSISGLQGEVERHAYCASKHGMISLTKSLALELGPYSIRVNAIAPGLVDTQMTQVYKSDISLIKKLNQNIPLSHWGTPTHITKAVEFLINNDYITGSTLVIDGGWTAGKI